MDFRKQLYGTESKKVNKMLNKIILMIAFTLSLFFDGCSDNIIEVKPPKDPRTYSWTADTLSYPGFFQTLVYDMWDSSANDVYAVGHASANDGVSGIMMEVVGMMWCSVNQKGATFQVHLI